MSRLIISIKAKYVIVMDMIEDKVKHCFVRAQGESYARVISFHKRMQRMLKRSDHGLLCLMPYIPELNPIKKI